MVSTSALMSATKFSTRAASPQQIVSVVVDCFFKSAELPESVKQFPQTFFLMHLWFMTSKDLGICFLNLYRDCERMISCSLPECPHGFSRPDCTLHRYKASICKAVRYWADCFPLTFDSNNELSAVINKLQELVIQDEDEVSTLASLVDISKIPSYEWLRSVSLRSTDFVVGGGGGDGGISGGAGTLRCRRSFSCPVFNKLQPLELAEQLTFLEFRVFRRIMFSDFKEYATQSFAKENPRLRKSVVLFNGISQWIQCMVLSKSTPQQRANIIVKFVSTAMILKQLNNFSSLMAVVGGLTHSCLARLNKTNSHLPPDTRKLLKEFTEFLSSANNFSSYRKALQNVRNEFHLPILGVHLKDLISLDTALPDRVDQDLLNIHKMIQLGSIFTELMQVHRMTLPFQPNKDLANTIRLALDMSYSEDEIYELSLTCEPRNSISSPISTSKEFAFADWISGVSLPDPQIKRKHIHDVVEAIFKNYDRDKDGFISNGEFEAIATNFPFVDSFAVIDADKDGKISKSEMEAYFVTSNSNTFGNRFKHEFYEATYFRPTFCLYCTGLLWGLVKQGWKCRDCNINAHKHCKDLVVIECCTKNLAERQQHPPRCQQSRRKVLKYGNRKVDA